jgi:hypothetical protein
MAGSVAEWKPRHPQISRLDHGYTSKSASRNIGRLCSECRSDSQ